MNICFTWINTHAIVCIKMFRSKSGCTWNKPHAHIHCNVENLINKRKTCFVLFQTACKDDALLQHLGAAATAVTEALNDLLQHIRHGAGPGQVSGYSV